MFLSTLLVAAGSWDQTCAPSPVLEETAKVYITLHTFPTPDLHDSSFLEHFKGDAESFLGLFP